MKSEDILNELKEFMKSQSVCIINHPKKKSNITLMNKK